MDPEIMSTTKAGVEDQPRGYVCVREYPFAIGVGVRGPLREFFEKRMKIVHFETF